MYPKKNRKNLNSNPCDFLTQEDIKSHLDNLMYYDVDGKVAELIKVQYCYDTLGLALSSCSTLKRRIELKSEKKQLGQLFKKTNKER